MPVRDVFISYARDDRSSAARIAHALETEGWSVWWDVAIPAGRTFDHVIQAALDAARCIVVLWSTKSVASEWVREEADEGKRRGILIPVLIEDGVEIPFGFRRIQAASLVGWNGATTADSFRRLVGDISAVLSTHPRSAEEQPQQPAVQLRHTSPTDEPHRQPTAADPHEVDAALQELNALIGLGRVKEEIAALVAFGRTAKMREQHGLAVPGFSLHLVLTGNPGTGISTVAMLVGRIYKGLGLLRSGHLVKVDRSGMVAEYVGHTALRTRAVINDALDGILFIDEVYALASDTSPLAYGQEAINTIIKAMEDYRGRLAVIFAGHSEPMRGFMKSNTNLMTRFNKWIEFPDYAPDELVAMFESLVERNHYRLAPEARDRIEEIVVKEHRQPAGKPRNALLVRNIFELAIRRQARRVGRLVGPSRADLQAIEADDVAGIEPLA